VSDPTCARILKAAQVLFSQRGFQRTSMADVAEAAKISRATLYGRFRDKAALFDGLAQGLVANALLKCREAWSDKRSFEANLEAALLAKDLPLHGLKHSPYGGDVLTANADSVRQYGDILDAGFVEIVTERARAEEARGVRFEAFGGINAFATFVSQAATGLKDTIRDERSYCDAVRQLATVCATALRAR